MGTTEAARSRVEPEALAAAAGDEAAFSELVERYRSELRLHCYRLLGSFEECEDLVQETFLRAWRRRSSFEGRATFRSWLYAIATYACLDALERRRRVPRVDEPARPLADVPWLQPYPDRLLEEIAADEAGPEATIVAKETVELAFIAAIQLLPARQRVALVARDVLGWSAAETAELLDTSVQAVNSALQRARTTMKDRLPARRLEWSSDTEQSAAERALLERYVEATERGDATAMVELMREDAFFSMPPQAAWHLGNEEIVAAWVKGGFGSESFGRLRCLPTRVNAQPAVAVYHRGPGEAEYRAFVLDVLRFEGGSVAEIVALDLSDALVAALELPPAL